MKNNQLKTLIRKMIHEELIRKLHRESLQSTWTDGTTNNKHEKALDFEDEIE